ncbi:ABC transporter ATP-binding protein [Tepidibacillus fermentans]|uniref:Iron complex transport system ATP-binding protein n=1 Tax=Tepidibacillus fermentans TaxID=1281767 RepID=A0A4R3KKL6_9BACI|nr:ABC transporter ATP-binding protein [Tepidibacillus fermentans]TCS83791.1 iron complex transport system ATP-binding protein [Tepidibacillus fermentans]
MSLFQVNHVSHFFGQKQVLYNIHFEIEEGSILGIIGPNGSGKTTLLHAMSGLFDVDEGEILFQGEKITSYRKKELARKIAVMSQKGTPPISFTVEEVVAMGRYPWLNFFSSLSSRDLFIVKQTLHQLGLWEKRAQQVATLSGGERQLVSLARAMVQQPEVLILDEPTTYLDIGHQMVVLEHIRRWQREKGITVIMVLHDLNLAAQYCSQLLLIHDGKMESLGKVEEVIRAEEIERVYQTKLIVVNHPKLKVPQILLQA